MRLFKMNSDKMGASVLLLFMNNTCTVLVGFNTTQLALHQLERHDMSLLNLEQIVSILLPHIRRLVSSA